MTELLIGLLFSNRSGFTFQLLFAELLFFSNAKHRPHFWFRLLTGIPTYILFSLFFPQPDENAAVGSTIILCASVLLMLFCYDEAWQNILFLCASSDSLQNAAMNLGRIFRLAFGLSFGPSVVVDSISVVFVYTASYFMLIQKGSLGNSIMHNETRTSPKLLISLTTMSTLIVLNTLFGSTGLDDNIYCRIALFCTGCFTLFIQYLLLRTERLMFERTLIENLLLAEREQYQISKENVDLINMKYHDIKHQINALRAVSPEEQDRALSELEEAVGLYDSITKTGNETLDTILTEKMLYCRHHDILLTYIVDISGLSAIQPMDLYSLFGNVLDNAIESVLRAPADKRMISLRITSQGNMTIIHLENYCAQVPTFQDGNPVTTKADKDNHGFGIKSIRYLAEKYHGNVSFQVEYDMFTVDILIPAA